MSLLAVLATQVGSGSVPAPEPEPDPRPAPLDETVAAIRPDGRRIWSATVSKDGTGDYADLTAAVDDAWAAWRSRLTDEGLREDQATPNYRTQIIVEPGTYEVTNLRMPPWGELIGRSRDQVTLTMPATPPAPAWYVLNLQSRFYCEGVTIVKPPGTGRYAVHNASGGTTIWADVGMFWEATEPWPFLDGVRPSGLDGGDGLTVLWYRCLTNGLVNSHGWDANTVPSTHIFVGHEGGVVGFRSGNGGNGLAADETWVVGGDVHQVSSVGVNHTLHLDPATSVRTTVNAPGGGVDQRVDWPVPHGGLSADDRARFGM